MCLQHQTKFFAFNLHLIVNYILFCMLNYNWLYCYYCILMSGLVGSILFVILRVRQTVGWGQQFSSNPSICVKIQVWITVDYIYKIHLFFLQLSHPKVTSVINWKYSSFKIFVKNNYYALNWCNFRDMNKMQELDYE